MKILLFGVSNIGKSITGELRSQRLGYDFSILMKRLKSIVTLHWKNLFQVGHFVNVIRYDVTLSIHLLLAKGTRL